MSLTYFFFFKKKTDPLSESRTTLNYVPRDEGFSEVKSLTFSAKTLYSVLHAVLPSLETQFVDPDLGFPYFTAIDSLFNEGVDLPVKIEPTLGNLIPRIIKDVTDTSKGLLRFETPEMLDSMYSLSSLGSNFMRVQYDI